MASQYGANDPQFVWLDMERVLAEHGLISFRSAAATIGGPADRGLGMTAEAIEAARDAMCRNGVRELPAERLQQSIDARMNTYQQAAAGAPIAAYVNVGGGIASTGGAKSKQQYRAGLSTNFGASREPPRDSVMHRFLEGRTPVIHLVEVQALVSASSLGTPRRVAQGLVGQHHLVETVARREDRLTMRPVGVLPCPHGRLGIAVQRIAPPDHVDALRDSGRRRDLH